MHGTLSSGDYHRLQANIHLLYPGMSGYTYPGRFFIQAPHFGMYPLCVATVPLQFIF
jgi:hypothetical protein